MQTVFLCARIGNYANGLFCVRVLGIMQTVFLCACTACFYSIANTPLREQALSRHVKVSVRDTQTRQKVAWVYGGTSVPVSTAASSIETDQVPSANVRKIKYMLKCKRSEDQVYAIFLQVLACCSTPLTKKKEGGREEGGGTGTIVSPAKKDKQIRCSR